MKGDLRNRHESRVAAGIRPKILGCASATRIDAVCALSGALVVTVHYRLSKFARKFEPVVMHCFVDPILGPLALVAAAPWVRRLGQMK